MQKRLRTRLCNCLESYKGTNQPISGKGKLTEKVINSMQNYYDMAIRNNVDHIHNMRKATGAVLYHSTDFKNQDYRHSMCPNNENSWCKYQLDKINGTQKYKNTINIPVNIFPFIKPIFQDLSKKELLSKRLHGQTQNTNKTLNAIIWTRCPKNIFVGRRTLEMGVNSAILNFNDGSKGLLDVLDYVDLSGTVTINKGIKRDTARVKQAIRKSSERGKKRRKTFRSTKKAYLDKLKEKEKTGSYAPGGF